MQGGGDARGKVKTIDEWTCLVQNLTSVEQAGTGIEGDPKGPAIHIDLVLALVERDFGEFVNGDVVMRRGALKIDVLLRYHSNPKVGPMFGHETDGMRFRKDSLIERFGVLLPEGEGGN